MDSKKMGIFQRHGAVLIQFARLIDCAILVFSLYVSIRFNGLSWHKDYLPLALFNVIFFSVSGSFYNLYRPWRVNRLYQEVVEVFICLLVALLLLTFVLHFFLLGGIKDSIVVCWFAVSFVLLTSYRSCVRLFQRRFRSVGYDHRKVCFIGMTPTAQKLAGTFAACPWMGLDVVGFFDERHISPDRVVLPGSGVTGTIDDLLVLVKQGKVDAIYITFPISEKQRVRELVDIFADTIVSIFYCPSFADFDLLNSHWDNIDGQPVISIIDTPFIGIQRGVKRMEDLALVAVILPLVALPMLVIAIAIKWDSPGPVLYKQSRYGLDGKAFKIFKFRSMHTMDSDNAFVQATKHDARVTRLGRILRKYSLDELPQVINVLLGDMSVIGPRPHPVKLNENHRKLVYGYMLRHKVKPGITGLAQVHGFRGETDSLLKMEKRVEYDLKYMKDWSVWLDIKILCKTVSVVFDDINAY